MTLVSSQRARCRCNFSDGTDLGLTQIYPIWDDDTNDERMAVSASLADSCLAILRDDSTLLFLQADDSGDLDEVVLGEDVASGKWISCCLYSDKTGLFSSIDRTLSEPVKNDMFLFLLSHDSKLFVSIMNPLREIFCSGRLLPCVDGI